MFRMDPIELIENLRNEVKRGKRECQNESLALFKKIFTSIETNTDTPSVNIGLDNLINEVHDLKTKLIEVTRERDNLLNTVDNLKIAMQQLSAKMMTTMQPLPIANDSKIMHEVKRIDNGKENSGLGAKEKEYHEIHEEASGENIKQPVKNSLNDSYDSDDYDSNNEVDVDIKEGVALDVKYENTIMNDYQDQNASKDVNLELQAICTKTEGGRQLKCNHCSYSTTTSYHMKSHVASVHLKLKSYQCKECGFAAARKSQVDRHYDAIHNKGNKKFKCGSCPYSAAQRCRLTKHIARVHQMDGIMRAKNQDGLD